MGAAWYAEDNIEEPIDLVYAEQSLSMSGVGQAQTAGIIAASTLESQMGYPRNINASILNSQIPGNAAITNSRRRLENVNTLVPIITSSVGVETDLPVRHPLLRYQPAYSSPPSTWQGDSLTSTYRPNCPFMGPM